jgi:hypothetical protein
MRRLPEATSTREGLLAIEGWWPPYFENQVRLYPALYIKVTAYLRRLDETTANIGLTDYPVSPATYLTDWYERDTDFQETKGGVVLVGETHLIAFVRQASEASNNGVIPMYPVYNNSFASATQPTLYQDAKDQKVYLIQNVNEGALARVVNVVLTWSRLGKNLGYQAPTSPVDPTTFPHAIYRLDPDGLLTPILDATHGEAVYLQILDYGGGSYAAILPLL